MENNTSYTYNVKTSKAQKQVYIQTDFSSLMCQGPNCTAEVAISRMWNLHFFQATRKLFRAILNYAAPNSLICFPSLLFVLPWTGWVRRKKKKKKSVLGLKSQVSVLWYVLNNLWSCVYLDRFRMLMQYEQAFYNF